MKGRGFKKCFVCSDPDLIKFNVTKKVTDVLENAGIDYEIYSKIKANPTVENVQTGVAAFKASGAAASSPLAAAPLWTPPKLSVLSLRTRNSAM